MVLGNKMVFTTGVLLFLALAAYGQQERVAILNTVDNRDSIGFSDLIYLTDRLRETAVKILPKKQYGVMTTESIVAFFGSQERAAKVCNESSCLAEVGRKVSADYVAQARVGRFGDQLSINFQLYNVKTGNLVDSFTGNSKDIFGLLAVIDEKSPDLFKQMIEESKPLKPELPELVKLEPEPVKPVLETPKMEEPKTGKPFLRTSFWVALGLDVVGAIIIYNGYAKHNEMWDAHEKYSHIGQNSYYRDAWEEVEDNHSSRNTLIPLAVCFWLLE
jgi:TolB-like protein